MNEQNMFSINNQITNKSIYCAVLLQYFCIVLSTAVNVFVFNLLKDCTLRTKSVNV